MAENKHPQVTITMDNGGEMVAELYPEVAPNTVNNFLALASSGFYDGLIFHRVIPGFMIQGEFAANGFANDLAHDRGVLSMARSASPDSAGSQFFIMVEKAPHLDGQYAAFGKVISGMETADAIVSAPRDWNDKPRRPQKIRHMTVETFGVEYPAPEKC